MQCISIQNNNCVYVLHCFRFKMILKNTVLKIVYLTAYFFCRKALIFSCISHLKHASITQFMNMCICINTNVVRGKCCNISFQYILIVETHIAIVALTIINQRWEMCLRIIYLVLASNHVDWLNMFKKLNRCHIVDEHELI